MTREIIAHFQVLHTQNMIPFSFLFPLMQILTIAKLRPTDELGPPRASFLQFKYYNLTYNILRVC